MKSLLAKKANFFKIIKNGTRRGYFAAMAHQTKQAVAWNSEIFKFVLHKKERILPRICRNADEKQNFLTDAYI